MEEEYVYLCIIQDPNNLEFVIKAVDNPSNTKKLKLLNLNKNTNPKDTFKINVDKLSRVLNSQCRSSTESA